MVKQADGWESGGYGSVAARPRKGRSTPLQQAVEEASKSIASGGPGCQAQSEEAEREAYCRWKGRVYAAEDMIKATDPRWEATEAACVTAGEVLDEAERAYDVAVQSREDLHSEILEQALVAAGSRPPRPRHDALRRQALGQEKKP